MKGFRSALFSALNAWAWAGHATSVCNTWSDKLLKTWLVHAWTDSAALKIALV